MLRIRLTTSIYPPYHSQTSFSDFDGMNKKQLVSYTLGKIFKGGSIVQGLHEGGTGAEVADTKGREGSRDKVKLVIRGRHRHSVTIRRSVLHLIKIHPTL